MGSSQLTISEIGCFDTAFCNTLEKIGIAIDPPALNDFFTSHNVYTYDKTDRANDDLYWNSVTKYCPQLVFNAPAGGAGFPPIDLAIVQFYYRSVQHPTLPNGQPNMVTHFCAVNSATDRSIIDSWDGQVKTPAQYEHVYGQPIAWATYVYHTPATVPASLPPSAPISAPVAITAVAPVPAPAAPRQLYLPPSVSVWHVYNPGGPWTLPYATHVLDPQVYGGLPYDIIGNPAPNIYLIKTEMFGVVAIYAGPDTVAQFPNGRGEGEDTATPPATGIPVSEVVPAPVSAEPSIALVVPPVVYSLIEHGPLSLVAREGAQLVNFMSGTIVETLEPGTPFQAVGKAVLADNDTYYMNAVNFANADQTQQIAITVGINIKYLALAPTDTAPTESVQVPVQVVSASKPTVAASASSGTIAPSSNFTPTLPWQGTFKRLPNDEIVTYLVKESMEIYSFVTGNDMQSVSQGTPVDVIGTFIYGGRRMYLPKSSAPKELGGKDTWYGSLSRRSSSKALATHPSLLATTSIR